MFKHFAVSAVLALSSALLLASCGGGANTVNPNPNPANTSDLFTNANAYTGDTSTAKIITAAAFEAQVKSGEITLETLEKRNARFEAAQRKIKADLDFLRAIPADQQSSDVKALLSSQVNLPTMPDGNYVLPVQQNSGSSLNVVTLGTPAMAAILVDTFKRSDSVDNQLEGYRIGYDSAPEAARANLPTPDSLQGKGLGAILAARDLLDGALEQIPNLDGVTEETTSSTSFASLATKVDVGDQGYDCPRGASGIYRNFAWPLKNFQSNIKNQGMRGTCWAFTAAAALESRDRVIFDDSSNLSEQFITNKVKREWGADDYNDGGGAEWALERAVDNNFLIPGEQYWPYNPAYGRPANAFQADDPKTPANEQIAGTMASYTGACGPAAQGADTLVYTWSCSETAHQSPFICAPAGDKKFCGYFRMVAPANATGSLASRTIPMWNNQWGSLSANKRLKKFPLAELRNALTSGYTLISSFGVFQGFSSPDANGFVTDFSDAGGRGGHVTLIVGYLDNAPLHRRLPNAPSDPNGFFVLKNSWGCSADGGYYYVPVNYVTRFFSDLSVLKLSSLRGENWKRQQSDPGIQNAPSIAIKANPARVDLRVQTDLAQFFKVTQTKVSSVNLKVSSSAETELYNGPWSTDTTALFGSSLKYSFKTPGMRQLSLVATNNGLDGSATLNVDVINTPPTLELQKSGDARQGEDYTLTAAIKDINETDLTALCANTVWSVEAPDSLSSTTGCTVKVKFGTQGPRTVKVRTQDSDGATGSSSAVLDVLPPPANPFPRISSSGVYSKEFRGGGGFVRTCSDFGVSSGSTIDLQEDGCSLSFRFPPRYSAAATVENPTGEALTYDWKLLVNNSLFLFADAAPKPLFGLSWQPTVPNGVVTQNCTVTLKVNAPDPKRSKGPITVWSGKCTYELVGPR
jgi:hypothetical protein